jgi:hypothetical protein
MSPPREGAALLQGRAICGRCGQYFRIRYAPRRGRQEAGDVCDRAHGARGEPHCQAIAGPPLAAAIGPLVTAQLTPAAVALALDIRRELETRDEEADQLRSRGIERAQIDAALAQRRFLRVDPNNRLVADTLEREWNETLRALAEAREACERARQRAHLVLDDTRRQRLATLTTDFRKLWDDPGTANRDRKRVLAALLEDATLLKLPAEGTTTIHLRFKGGKTEPLTTLTPKASAQQVTTPSAVGACGDHRLEHHIYEEIADMLNKQGLRPGGSARRGQSEARFTAVRVASLAHAYNLRSRYERLRARGMLTMREATARLGIHEATLVRWVEYGLVTRHAYKAHAYLYEVPDPHVPEKHCSRWDRLADRAAALQTARQQNPRLESKEV